MSNLPLYREVRENPPIHDPRKPFGHSGLWFERFYDRYHPKFTDTKNDDDAFRNWLKAFDHRSGESELLDSAIERQALLIGALGGQFAVFKSDWHFVSGMGYPHPLENGFNWHPVWGVPYLPGASLKGLVRAWVESWEFEDDTSKERKEKLRHWFGSESKDGDDVNSQNTGEVIFFDAIPTQPVNLTADIMTPHMGAWYAEGGSISDVSRDADKIPADWHSPNPIYFLSAREPVFLISIAPRNEQVAANIDLDEVMECVALALEWLGAGAKTAVGYGQFTQDDVLTSRYQNQLEQKRLQLQEQQQQAAALQGLSGVALELMQYSQEAQWETNKNAFVQPGGVDVWMEKLMEEPEPSSIEFLETLFDKHLSGLLQNPHKTKGKKKKPVYSAHQQKLAELFFQLKEK